MQVSYALRADNVSDTQIPVFITLVNPSGIRVPLAGVELEGGTFWNPGMSAIGENVIPGTATESPTISWGSSLVSLEAFSSMPANGTWWLEVMNPDTSRTYTLESWAIALRTAEQSVVTDAEGTYDFPSDVLSLTAGVGTFLPTLELPADRRLTAGHVSRPIELRVGETQTADFSVSLPLVQRPELRRSATLHVSGSVLGPQPVAFSWADLSAAVLADSSGVRLVVTTLSGQLEKLVDGQWLAVGMSPDSGSPRELLAILPSRVIKPGDHLRWVPPAKSSAASSAFAVIGWDGLAISASDSTIHFESIAGS